MEYKTVSDVPDVKILEPKVYGDSRGFFYESFRQDWFEEHCGPFNFVQDNHSKSSRGILRGLHYQTTNTQGKLVRVVSGEVYDVVVDLRKGSTSLGRSFGIYLSADNKKQLWVPPGFAHGFYVVSEHAEFTYKCTDYYHPDSEVTLAYDDPALDIDWPIDGKPLLSEKDANGYQLSKAPLMEL